MFRFHVVSVAAENNLRGIPMRRVTLRASPAEGFGSEQKNAAPPDGSISMLVTLQAAKKFQIGDEFPVIFQGQGS